MAVDLLQIEGGGAARLSATPVVMTAPATPGAAIRATITYATPHWR
jgi:hypothetical protein